MGHCPNRYWTVRFFLGAPDFLLHCLLAIGGGAHSEACDDARSTQLANDFAAAFDRGKDHVPFTLDGGYPKLVGFWLAYSIRSRERGRPCSHQRKPVETYCGR